MAYGPVNIGQLPLLEQVDECMASKSASHVREQYGTQNVVAHCYLVQAPINVLAPRSSEPLRTLFHMLK